MIMTGESNWKEQIANQTDIPALFSWLGLMLRVLSCLEYVLVGFYIQVTS